MLGETQCVKAGSDHGLWSVKALRPHAVAIWAAVHGQRDRWRLGSIRPAESAVSGTRARFRRVRGHLRGWRPATRSGDRLA